MAKKRYKNTKKGQTERALADPSVSSSKWYKRANDEDPIVIPNEDGTTSTHKMAYAQIGDKDAKKKDRRYLAYPTIRQNEGGSLTELYREESLKAVYDKEDGAVFKKKRHAKYFSKKGYKKATGMDKRFNK